MFGKRQSIGKGTIAGYRMDPKQRMQRLHYAIACAKWSTLSDGDKEAYEAWAEANDVTIFSSFLHSYLEELKTALSLYMPMDALINSEVTDYSQYANHGTNHNCVLQRNEFIANCLKFDGSTAYVDCPDDPTLDTADELTTALWFNKDQAQYGRLLYKYGSIAKRGYYIKCDLSNDNIKFVIFANTSHVLQSVGTLPSTTWIHVAATRIDPWRMCIYLNGTLASVPVASPSGTLANKGDLFIGQDYAGGNRFDGFLDEIRIYKKELTAEEIRAMYILESKWHGDMA